MELRFDIKDIFRIIRQELVDPFDQSKWIPLLTALAALSPQIGPVPHISYIHIPLIALCVGMNLGRHWSVEKACVAFLFYLPISIIVSDPDPVFQSWTRMVLFMFVFILVSPFFKGEYIANMRREILTGTLLISTIVSIGSFFCYFLGVNYMTFQGEERGIDVYMGSAGSFGGLSVHSMVLALFGGVATLWLFYRSQKYNGEGRWVYWILMGLSLATVAFSASRSALLATIAGLLVMLYYIKKENGSFIKSLLVIVVGAMLTFPLWEGALEGVLKKQANNDRSGEQYGSRTLKWESRMEEFASSPVFGVGFSAQDPNGKDYYDKKTGTVEPGSSWLCILSMTGIIGFILILYMFVSPIPFLQNTPIPYNCLLLGLMSFFFMSFVSEGYIFAGGNGMCSVAWLVFGCANDVKEGYWEDSNNEDDELEEYC